MLRQTFQTAWQTTRTRSRESWQLGQVWMQRAWQQRAVTSGLWRDVLLQQAPQNQVAINFLLMDKQIGLLRYHGVAGYIQQTAWWQKLRNTGSKGIRIRSSSSSSSAASNTESQEATPLADPNTTPSTSEPKVAKVAFMVTARMKVELAEMGYEESHIRSMTPNQATLVLLHDVPPDDYDAEITVLEADADAERMRLAQIHAEQQQKQEDERREAMEVAAAAEARTNAKADERKQEEEKEAQNKDSPIETTDISPTTLPLENESVGETAVESPMPSAKGAVLWYELVDPTGPDEVVALYRTQHEAEEGLQIRQELAETRGKDAGLEIRPSWR